MDTVGDELIVMTNKCKNAAVEKDQYLNLYTQCNIFIFLFIVKSTNSENQTKYSELLSQYNQLKSTYKYFV